jgi:hypothetical protein
MILLYYLYIYKQVYISECDTPGKPNNKRCRISRLKNSTSSRTLFQSPKPRCKSTNVFTNILKIQYDYTKTLYIFNETIKVIIIVTVTLYFNAVHRHTRLGVTTPPVNV